MQPILASLFPRTVSVAGGRPEDVAGRLYAEEERLIDGAVAKRRREFTAGRLFARQALAGLGRPASSLLSQDRRPLWPAGTTGSITHARDRCAAAAALLEDVAGIGLDVEVLGAVTSELQLHVLTEPERDWLASMPAATQPHWATLTFSAKEAFYKSLVELGVGFVEFDEVRILHDTNCSFEVIIESTALAAKLHNLVITGRSAVEGDRIWTAVTLERKD
jgi:4'-phosphopantetheinyl transferase EntD